MNEGWDGANQGGSKGEMGEGGRYGSARRQFGGVRKRETLGIRVKMEKERDGG